MAFFSKEAYARKSEYAHRVSDDSLVALSAATGLDEDALRCVSALSHRRHELHSTDRSSFVNGTVSVSDVGSQFSGDDTIIDSVNSLQLLPDLVPMIDEPEIDDSDSFEDVCDALGIDISDTSLLLDAWKRFSVSFLSPDHYDSAELDDDDVESIQAELKYGLLLSAWDDAINTWSADVRAWFRRLNSRYGTSYPD